MWIRLSKIMTFCLSPTKIVILRLSGSLFLIYTTKFMVPYRNYQPMSPLCDISFFTLPSPSIFINLPRTYTFDKFVRDWCEGSLFGLLREKYFHFLYVTTLFMLVGKFQQPTKRSLLVNIDNAWPKQGVLSVQFGIRGSVLHCYKPLFQKFHLFNFIPIVAPGIRFH